MPPQGYFPARRPRFTDHRLIVGPQHASMNCTDSWRLPNKYDSQPLHYFQLTFAKCVCF
ncbi:hypothetical protein MHYP_G00202270 [Metynnis hypsauchen]